MKKQFLSLLVLLFFVGMTYAQEEKTIVKSDKTETINGKKFYLHTIEKGHTLYSIAKVYQIDIKVLEADTNNLHLKLGQIIQIPCKIDLKEDLPKNDSLFQTHTVLSKETLYGISRKYNVDEEDILKANPELKDGLKLGQVIRIPIKKKVEVKQEEPKLIPKVTKPVEKTIKAESKVEEAKSVEKVIEDKPNSDEPKQIKQNKKKTYNVALLIPLYLKNMDDIIPENIQINNQTAADFKSFTFIQFYEGFMQVADTLAQQGLNVKIYTYDIPDDTLLAANFLKKNDLSKMDLIIGPFFYKTYKVVADFAKTKKIPIINPFSERRNILDGNPYAFKLIPAYQNQVENVANYLVDSFPNANILLVHNNKDIEKKHAEIFKTAINEAYKEKHTSEGSVKEIIYSQVGFAGLQSKLSLNRDNILITLIESELFVTSYISKLNSIKDQEITLIAPLQWKNFDKIETEYFLKLNTHFFEPNFVDYEEADTKAFILKFRERYKAEPNEMAFTGHDAALYFLTALMNYGEDFPDQLSKVNVHTLQTRYVFKRAGENNGYENTFVNIYKMEDYKFLDKNK
ncbi:MAG: LysM peptidoglycan-binding domain-containing protein [Bacteroidales bacterium]